MNVNILNESLQALESSIQLDRTYIKQQKRLLEELHCHNQPVMEAQRKLQKLESLEKRHVQRRGKILRTLSKWRMVDEPILHPAKVLSR